jgi:hypothetical protein
MKPSQGGGGALFDAGRCGLVAERFVENRLELGALIDSEPDGWLRYGG